MDKPTITFNPRPNGCDPYFRLALGNDGPGLGMSRDDLLALRDEVARALDAQTCDRCRRDAAAHGRGDLAACSQFVDGTERVSVP
jgi:hypothetical protein